jgi:hypothetical protein
MNVAHQRLHLQGLSRPRFAAPADCVRWFGAVQAQDYAGALWAIGLRTKGATEASVERALADRAIVRTWPLRGTLHFVAAEDVRWMLTHFAPRRIAQAALRFRQLDLDDGTVARSAGLFVKALEGGGRLTRPEMYALLDRAGIATANARGLHILWRCAHDGLICFGPRDGKQQTFVLLDEWVRRGRILSRDEALAELAQRYFTSHEPATLKDFTWWSGLSAADARAAAATRSGQTRGRAGRRTTWAAPRIPSPHVALLPPYDEYTVAYVDRSAALDPAHRAVARNSIFSPTILLDGRIVGTWSRTEAAKDVHVSTRPFRVLRPREARALEDAVAQYRTFKRPMPSPRSGSRSTR